MSSVSVKMNRRILWGIVAFIVAWYVLYYYRPPKTVAMLQTTLANFHFDLLLQRQPVVLYDRITQLDDLQKVWFPRNRVVYSDLTGNNTWDRTTFKYLLIHSQQDGEIALYPAFEKLIINTDANGNATQRPPDDAVLLSVKLKASQGLILPYRWYYCLPSGTTAKVMGVHDYLTPWLPRF